MNHYRVDQEKRSPTVAGGSETPKCNWNLHHRNRHTDKTSWLISGIIELGYMLLSLGFAGQRMGCHSAFPRAKEPPDTKGRKLGYSV